MMSTNTMSGWWSAIFASASKPSIAVNTSHPSLARSVSAVRRIVLLSSITRTFRPWSFVLLPVTVRQLLQLDLMLELTAPKKPAGPEGPCENEAASVCGAGDYTQCLAVRHRPLHLRNEALRVLTYRPTPRHAGHVTLSDCRPAPVAHLR